ncbi:hypothetical protein [Brevibacillus dissolubilis]|uniref:hypothetical protein n=1 Tax=Brevibacillus dissolubilis TaxID=1844116 RepID=UPI001116425D|nr:hypothetical protein [Brevibacillus dissolubilis]
MMTVAVAGAGTAAVTVVTHRGRRGGVVTFGVMVAFLFVVRNQFAYFFIIFLLAASFAVAFGSALTSFATVTHYTSPFLVIGTVQGMNEKG